ncbi:MAG: hypothetical protein ACRDOI_11335 [Trebonia sp.]
MRFIRSAAATLTLAGAATLAASAVPTLTAPAFAQGPTVSVVPSTVLPGGSVTFSITCDTPTAGSAMLFGTTLGLPQHIPMNPTTTPGEFTVRVTLPTGISPGQYSPAIDCSDLTARTASLTVNPANTTPVIDVTPTVAAPGTAVTFAITCGSGATSATLFGTTLGLAEHIPMGPSTHTGEFAVTVDLPASIGPGYYSPSIDCDNGVNGLAALTVNLSPPPSGAPVTGDGATSSAMGGPFTAAGLGLLAAGGLAVGTGAIRKRRRAGDSS